MGKETLTDTFQLLRQRLHTAACRILQDDDDADDAVQDTFCNLWNAREPETSTEARCRMFAVLKNVCINKLRQRRPQADVEKLAIPVEDQNAGDAQRLASHLLSVLTPMQQQIVRLSAIDDLDYEEIAGRLGMSIDAVRMHICRARKKMRQLYEKQKK